MKVIKASSGRWAFDPIKDNSFKKHGKIWGGFKAFIGLAFSDGAGGYVNKASFKHFRQRLTDPTLLALIQNKTGEAAYQALKNYDPKQIVSQEDSKSSEDHLSESELSSASDFESDLPRVQETGSRVVQKKLLPEDPFSLQMQYREKTYTIPLPKGTKTTIQDLTIATAVKTGIPVSSVYISMRRQGSKFNEPDLFANNVDPSSLKKLKVESRLNVSVNDKLDAIIQYLKEARLLTIDDYFSLDQSVISGAKAIFNGSTDPSVTKQLTQDRASAQQLLGSITPGTHTDYEIRCMRNLVQATIAVIDLALNYKK